LTTGHKDYLDDLWDLLPVDPIDFLENPPSEDESEKTATSEWLYDHWKDVDAHHNKYTDVEARASINDIFGSDGKADSDIDLDIYNLTTPRIIMLANGRIGVTDGNPQILFDNVNNWLEITGKVGVGTATPSEQLDVNINQNATTLIRVGNLNTGNAARSGVEVESDGGSGAFLAFGENYAAIPNWAESFVLATDTSMGGGIVFYSNQKVRIQNVAGTDALSVIDSVVTINNLSGIGSRNVVADENGVLSAP